MKFNIKSEFKFQWCGKFAAPNEKWIHETRECGSYELFYVTSGTLYISDGSKEYTVKTGEYLITEPCVNQHGWKNSKCSFYWFHFISDEGGAEFPYKGMFNNTEMIERYYNILQNHNGNCEHGGNIIKALLSELCQKSKISEYTISDDIKGYIKFASAAQLNVSFIAGQFNYSTRYISHIFHKETGVQLKKYILDEIIERAKNLLVNTDLSVNDIGISMGYSDGHNFSHAFKRILGISPQEYRGKVRLVK